MSRKKPNGQNRSGWQKVEITKPQNGDVREEPVSEQETVNEQPAKAEEAASEQPAKAEEAASEQPVKAEEAASEQPVKAEEAASEPPVKPEKAADRKKSAKQKTSPKQAARHRGAALEPGKDGNSKPKASRRRNRKISAAVPLGGAFVLLALIGLITVIVFGVRATESLIDNSKQKEEFADIIMPVLMFDPVPFEDPNEMGELALLRSSIWSAIIENGEKYSVGDGNMVSVPQSDVDVACAKLFGQNVTLNHQSFEDYLSIYSFNEETKTYYVPVDASILYTPQVEDITRNGDIFELTVGYLEPDSQWLQSIKGEKSEPTPSKYMIYQLQKVDDHYQLIAIQDPPEGAVPGIPNISQESQQSETQTSPAGEPQTIEPQTIEPAGTEEETTAPSEEQTETTEEPASAQM